MQFPTLTTKDLNGDTQTLPRDFAGEFNLLLVAYQRWHQREVDSWLALADELEAAMDNFRYYELPVVGEMNWLGRTQLDFFMRTGIRERETRARTLTLYVDRAEFRRELNISTEETIALLLLDADGNVLWQGLGAFSDETAQSLRQAVQRAAATSGSTV